MTLMRKVQLTDRKVFCKVLHQLCLQTEEAFKKVLSINPNNLMAQVELAQIGYLKSPVKEEFKKAIQENETLLSKATAAEDKEYIKVKIMYCDAAVKKF